MSLTPGFILADEGMASHIGVTLAEIAAIVGEWDRASGLTQDARRCTPNFTVKGEHPPLVVGWDRYVKRPVMEVRRGGGESVYLYAADIAEMRQVLAGQVAP